ncbi:hypothetical protein Bbelb_375790 [Branchiostoma belcheri]|nr:hypothetical protein Bbelb_375790 [Branchiostoma belcheri]
MDYPEPCLSCSMLLDKARFWLQHDPHSWRPPIDRTAAKSLKCLYKCRDENLLSDGHNSPHVLLRAVYVQKPYERATYGLRESNFTILTCNCCTDSAQRMCVPRTVLASSVLTPHFPVDLLNDHAEHTCTIPVYKDDLTGDCQLVSKMPRKAQKKTTRQDPKKRAAEDTRAASDDEVNRRCTHLQRASTACTRQRSNRTEIVRCKHVQLTYHLRNVRCTQPLTARRVVQTTSHRKFNRKFPSPCSSAKDDEGRVLGQSETEEFGVGNRRHLS